MSRRIGDEAPCLKKHRQWARSGVPAVGAVKRIRPDAFPFVRKQSETLRATTRDFVQKYPNIPGDLAKTLSAVHQLSVQIDDSPLECRNLVQEFFYCLSSFGADTLCVEEWKVVRKAYKNTTVDEEKKFNDQITKSEAYGLFVYSVLCSEYNESKKTPIPLNAWREFLKKTSERANDLAPAIDWYEGPERSLEESPAESSDESSDESPAGRSKQTAEQPLLAAKGHESTTTVNMNAWRVPNVPKKRNGGSLLGANGAQSTATVSKKAKSLRPANAGTATKTEKMEHHTLSNGWRKCWSKTKGIPYYHNTATGENQWELPGN